METDIGAFAERIGKSDRKSVRSIHWMCLPKPEFGLSATPLWMTSPPIVVVPKGMRVTMSFENANGGHEVCAVSRTFLVKAIEHACQSAGYGLMVTDNQFTDVKDFTDACDLFFTSLRHRRMDHAPRGIDNKTVVIFLQPQPGFGMAGLERTSMVRTFMSRWGEHHKIGDNQQVYFSSAGYFMELLLESLNTNVAVGQVLGTNRAVIVPDFRQWWEGKTSAFKNDPNGELLPRNVRLS